jgi:uncharacterized protein (TIGR03382 family)
MHRSTKHVRSAFATALALAVILLTPAARALNFPGDAQWVALTKSGKPLSDPPGDIQPPAIDIVGDASNPPAYVFVDAGNLFLRLRVNGSVKQSANAWQPYAWACLIKTGTADAAPYAVWDGIDGIATPQNVELLQNSSQQAADPTRDPADATLATYPLNTNARDVAAGSNFGGDADFFVDWAVSMSDLAKAGITTQTPMRFICGTSKSEKILDGDLIGDEAGAGGPADTVQCTASSCSACTTTTACGPSCAACSGSLPVCNPSIGCVASCTSNAQCSGATPVCDTANNACVGCLSGADCAAGTYCDTASHTCAQCPQGATTCTGGGTTPVSDSIQGGSFACNAAPAHNGPGLLAWVGLAIAMALRRRR